MDDTPPDKIAEIFNIPPMSTEIVEVENQELELISEDPISEEELIEQDFKVAREALLSAMEVSTTALKSLKQIADGTQHPRAFEAIATLIGTSVTASKDLLELHSKKKTLSGNEPKSQTINNNLVISTNDLLKMIKGDG